MFPQFLHLQQLLLIQYFLILNIRTYTLDNPSLSSPTTPAFFNPAGDDLHSIILKVPLHHYTGLPGVRLLPHPHRGHGWDRPLRLLQHRHRRYSYWTCATWPERLRWYVRFKRLADSRCLVGEKKQMLFLFPVLWAISYSTWFSHGTNGLTLFFRSVVHFTQFVFDAMAPKDLRHHPYRATSNVETPVGTQSCSWTWPTTCWYWPPPDRPILIIVDYSPLQSLARPSELDHASPNGRP